MFFFVCLFLQEKPRGRSCLLQQGQLGLRQAEAASALVPALLQGVWAGIPNTAQLKLAEAVWGKKQKALRADKTLERVQAAIPTGLQRVGAVMSSCGAENQL